MALITCKDLKLGYNGREIIQNLSFQVDRGNYLCIVGENGSGKSTLMRTILGLQAPMSGQIQKGDGLKESQIGYLPQQTPVQKDFPASVWEVVLSLENIRSMGLSNLINRCYRELSGGQQQRVLLARALCATDTLLFLDEPVSGLDPKVTEEMYALIEKLNREQGITVIMISHDIQAALRYATHILHIGGAVFFGTREEYLRSGILTSLMKGGGQP